MLFERTYVIAVAYASEYVFAGRRSAVQNFVGVAAFGTGHSLPLTVIQVVFRGEHFEPRLVFKAITCELEGELIMCNKSI